jgi:hypothetical protein
MAAALARLAAMFRDTLESARAPEPMGEQALRARLIGMVLSEGAWPFLQVWLEIVARGGRGDALYRDAGRAIAEGFVAWIAAQSDAPTEAARTGIAQRLLPLLDGLILLRAVGLAETCAAPWLAESQPGR